MMITNEKELQVPSNDTATYYCRIDYLDQLGCDFTLHTEVRPRVPFANFEYEWIPNNCKNQVKFTSKSEVLTRIDSQEVSSGEKVENHYWSINGEVVSELTTFVYDVDSMGETLNLNLSVGISDNQCMDDSICSIEIPAIYSERNVIDTTICDGEYISTNFGGFFTDTLVVHTEKSKWCGCDSITVLDLKVLEQPEDQHVYDTICSSDVYMFNGKEITEAGEHKVRLTTTLGCDSVVILHLEKQQPIEVSISDEYRYVCADDSVLIVEYQVPQGVRAPTEYSVVFDEAAESEGFVDKQGVAVNGIDQKFIINIPKDCKPNSYTATIILKDASGICADWEFSIDFDVYYSSSILQPKFGNLITILDKTSNGGYEFEDEYQWYKNDVLIEGEEKSYLFLPEGEVFGENDCYFIVVKRKDDGVVMRTCEICPGVTTAIDDVFLSDKELLQYSLFQPGQRIDIDNISGGYVKIYTFAGQLLYSYNISLDGKDILPVKPAWAILLSIFIRKVSYYIKQNTKFVSVTKQTL